MIDIDELTQKSSSLRLLYVEDNVDSREMTAMVLEDFFDDIVIAVNGEDGYEKFLDNDIDVIITDLNMPKMGGLEMVEKIRSLDPNIPVLVLSAHNETEFLSKSEALHVDGYLLKPIDLDQLIESIDAIVTKIGENGATE